MSKKSRERRKAREAEAEGKAKPAPRPKDPATVAALRRRRNRRLMLIGFVAVSFPIFEVVAYQFRVITVTFVNHSDEVIPKIQMTYDGGKFEVVDLKPGASEARRIRPDFSFGASHFSTYRQTIRYATKAGQNGLVGTAGALDFSARETYTIEPQLTETGLQLQLQHSTRPGFPMNLVRDLMEGLGIR